MCFALIPNVNISKLSQPPAPLPTQQSPLHEFLLDSTLNKFQSNATASSSLLSQLAQSLNTGIFQSHPVWVLGDTSLCKVLAL